MPGFPWCWYQFKTDLLQDAIGGLTVGIMHVPQGIAYALLAGVDPVIGLYTSFFPVLAYMLFGTSRHTSTGTFAVVALMTGKAVIRLSGQPSDDGLLANSTMVPDGPTPVQVASALTVLMGLIQAAVAVLGLDFVTTYFSDELVGGFTTGASMHVFITQFKDITGIYGLPRRDGPANALLVSFRSKMFLELAGFMMMLQKVYDLCKNIPRTNLMTLGMSAVTMLVLILGKDLVNPLVQKRCPVPIPFELIAVIVGTLVCQFAQLNQNFNVRTVGEIPTGLPPPTFPRVELFSSLVLDAISISIVVMAIHVSLSKMLAKKYQYEVNTNQLCAIFSSIFIFIVVQFSGSWLQPLPMCVLGSIIVVALLGMFQKFTQLPRLWRLSKIDFSIWLVAFVATIGIDVMQGLAIAIAFALFTTVIREQWPRWHILANISGTNDFRDMERYRHIYFFNSVCVLRFDSPLLFTNVERFRKIVDKLANDWNNVRCCGKIDKRHLILGEQNEKHETTSDSSHPTKRYLIIDCSGFAYVDVMGVNSLKEIYEEMRARNIKVSFAAAKAPVRELFEASGLYAAVAKTNFYPTIYDAVSYAQLEQSTSHMDEIALDENSYENDAVDTTDETIRTPDTPEKSDDARQ
ncbi:STAS domain protein [Ancylostoma ceylanicum]|uniref:STAS domain protein n=2 Tax=Ancylostoma ceylanicum TaxID=53326 RepID=A0A0D6LRV1_9BILA|nr:STAS domain protein [Ancylostoma ceylanicum]